MLTSSGCFSQENTSVRVSFKICEIFNKSTYFEEHLQAAVSENVRSSLRRCSVKKGVLRNFAKLTGKHQCQRVFFNKVAGFRSATLLKKIFLHRCFPVNFARFLRTPLLQNTSGRLLLNCVYRTYS